MSKEDVWEEVKRTGVFFMRGTMREIMKEDMSHFDDGRELIVVIFRPEDLEARKK